MLYRMNSARLRRRVSIKESQQEACAYRPWAAGDYVLWIRQLGIRPDHIRKVKSGRHAEKERLNRVPEYRPMVETAKLKVWAFRSKFPRSISLCDPGGSSIQPLPFRFFTAVLPINPEAGNTCRTCRVWVFIEGEEPRKMASYFSPSSQARTSCGTSLALRFRTDSGIVAQRRWQLNCSPTTSVMALEMRSASRPATYEPRRTLGLQQAIPHLLSKRLTSALQRLEVNGRIFSPCPIANRWVYVMRAEFPLVRLLALEGLMLRCCRGLVARGMEIKDARVVVPLGRSWFDC